MKIIKLSLFLMAGAFIPTFAHADNILMNGSDSSGQSSFNAGTHWTGGAAPTAGNTYDTTSAYTLRTPITAGTYTFAGDSLTLTGPGTTTAGGGRFDFAAPTSTIIIANLIATNLAFLQQGGQAGSTFVLAGGLTIQSDPSQNMTNGCIFSNGNGRILVTASISGSGAIDLGSPSAGANGNTVTLAGDLSAFTGQILTTSHTHTTPLVVSNVTDQVISGVISILDAFTKQGPAKLTLIGTNTYTGTTTVSAGTLILAGNEASVTNTTTVSSGATLQLQANSSNIVSGVSYALGTISAATNSFSVGSTIQFRSDSSVTFNGGNNLGGLGNGTNSWDVNQVTGAGANNTVTFALAGFNVFNSTFNITGGNGYSLSVGPMNLLNTGGTLTLNASNANLTVNGITSSGGGGLTTVLGASNTTISAAITATTSLTKQGTGILTLNGANSYAVSTLIQTGTVFLASGTTLASTNLNISAGAMLDAGALGGPLALNSGQCLAGNGTVNGSVDTASGGLIFPGGNFTAGTLTVTTNLALSSGGTLSFDLAHNTAIGGGTNDLIVVGGNLNVAGSTTLALNFLNGSPATGTYTLIQYGTISGTLASITLPINARYSLILSNDTVHKAVELVVSGVPANLVWLGNGSDNAWDNAGVYQNWTNSGSLSRDYFYNGDNTTFNDLGSDSPVINLTTVNSPGSLVVNATQTYDFSGSGGIAGVTSLNKSGSGTLILETANSYAGPTIINSGAVQVGNGNASGSLGSSSITNNGSLVMDRSDAVVLPSPIYGSGTVTMAGGNITASGSNYYTGATFINSGITYLTNAAGLGATNGGITVAGGAQLYVTVNADLGTRPLSLIGNGDGNGALRKGRAGVASFEGAVTLTGDTTLSVDSGATLNLTNASGLNGASANANLTFAGSGAGNIAGPLSLGSGSLTDNGGTWTVAPNNSYTGFTTINGGALYITGPLSLGPVPASFSASDVTLNGGTLGTTTNVALNDGNIGIQLTASSVINVQSNATFIISNSISTSSGAFSLTKTGAGTLVLNGSNPFNGILNIDGNSTTANDGTTVIANNTAIANIPAITGAPFIYIRDNNGGSSTLALNGSSGSITVAPDISLDGRNANVQAIENIAGNNTISGNFTLLVGGGYYIFQSDAGTLALTAPLPYATPTSGGRTFTFQGSGNISVPAVIQDGSNNGFSNVWNSVIKTGAGVLNLSVANTYSGATTVSNGVLSLTGSLNSLGGVTAVGGLLVGNGTITGPVTVGPGGSIEAGTTNSLGTLTLASTLILSGNTVVKINKTAATSDLFTGQSSVTYGGILTVANISGTPALNDSFTLFTPGASASNFSSIIGSPGPGLAYSFTNGVLSVVTAPAPLMGLKFTANPVVSGTSLTISATNSGAGTIYLLTSTNLAASINTWTPIWTNVLTGNGSFTTNLLNAVNPALKQQFYILSNTNN